MTSVMDSPVEKIGATFLDIIETLAISFSVFLVIYLFFLMPHEVNGQSMVPNFQSGEQVLTDKVTYRMRDPQRGEIIVFHSPAAANCVAGTGCDFIKRIIGVPGDTIEVKENAIWINGEALPEPYIPSDYVILPGNATKDKVIYLGENEFFVCGDNRPYSSDSRSWGPITKDEIVGRVFFRYWPLGVIGTVSKSEYPSPF
jgi:signal peptidase I